MASRPAWEGSLRFSLISVPVKAHTASAGGRSNIGFHLLHKGCNSRIRYKKVCPIHGEVQQADIVSGYEYAKGKYVLMEQEEIGKLRPESDKSINIDAFISADDLDPIYFSGRTYYLLPANRAAEKPYAVLQEVMSSKKRYGVGELVLSGREHLAVVRGSGSLLILSMLTYAEQLKSPTEFENEIVHPKLSTDERKLAETLIEASTKDEFDIEKYKDDYVSNLNKLVDAKVKGKKLVTGRAKEEPAVINLMDALKKSLQQKVASVPDPKRPSGGKGTRTRRRKTA